MEKKYLEMPLEDKLELLKDLKQECEYYLGEGKKQVSCLQRGSVNAQLRDMQELLFSIPREDRPGWLDYLKIKKFDKKMDHRTVITAELFVNSEARFIGLLEPRREDEIFFSVKRRDYDEKDKKTSYHYKMSEYGCLKVTPGMKKIFDTLIQENHRNRNIECIEWDDSWNIVFHDGIYISAKMCRMEKDEFEKWYRTIAPVAVAETK